MSAVSKKLIPASSEASMASSACWSSTGPQPPPTAHKPVPMAVISMPDFPKRRVVRVLIMHWIPVRIVPLQSGHEKTSTIYVDVHHPDYGPVLGGPTLRSALQ